MFVRSNKLTVLIATNYLLAVSVSSLFHNHGDCDHDHATHGVSASHGDDDHDCLVCQFLAQKPAPAASITTVDGGELLQEVVALAPSSVADGVFTAWRSRAPPVLA